MKNTLKIFFLLIGRILSCIYPLYLSKKIQPVWSLIYSAWLSRSFKLFYESSIIMYPCLVLGAKYISVGKNTVIGKHGVITAWDRYMNDHFNPQIIIGDNVSIGEYCHITSINKIIIGNGVLTGRWITITDNSHGKIDEEEKYTPPVQRQLYSKGSVTIEDNVWIGDKVSIMSGVRVGKGAVIAANAVVTKDVPEYSVVGGVPAKILKRN